MKITSAFLISVLSISPLDVVAEESRELGDKWNCIANEGASCGVDPETMVKNDCCSGMECSIEKSDEGQFIPVCVSYICYFRGIIDICFPPTLICVFPYCLAPQMPKKVTEASAKELLQDHKVKQQTCIDLEFSLDIHYEAIAEIHKDFDRIDPEESPMGLLVDTLCKNLDRSNDPGL